jgi:fucose permease
VSEAAGAAGAGAGSAAGAVFARDRATWLLYLLVGYYAFLQTVLGPVMPFLRSELGLGYAVAALHFSLFAVGSVLVGVVGPALGRRWGRWGSLWGGAAGMAFGAGLVGLSPSPLGTLAGASLMGFFGTLLLVGSQAGLADRHGPRFAVAIAEANVAASGCAILASAAVGGLARVGLEPRLAPLLALPALALIAARFGRTPLGRAARRAGAVDAVGSGRRRLPRAFWAIWLILFLAVSVEWSVAYWGAEFLAAGGGLARADAAAAMGLFFGAMAGGRIAGSRLARRVAAARLLLGALALALIGFPLFWLGPTAPASIGGLVVVGLGIANVYPQAVAAAAATAPGMTDLATARVALAGGGAVLLAPLTLGALADRWGIERALGAAVPLLLAAIAIRVCARGRAAALG